jgi:hypothetical protein
MLSEEVSYDLVLIVTCIDSNFITQMMNSVILNNHSITVLIILINQVENNYEFVNENRLVTVNLINSRRISLSAARNVGINYLVETKIKFKHIMFPDDDSTYSDDFFSRFKENINTDSNYLIDIYCQGSDVLYKKTHFKDREVLNKNNFYAAMSVNMIINFKTFNSVGLLDERLGAGAKYGGGEDVDYYIRSCIINPNGFIYLKAIYCYHPSASDRYAQMSLCKMTDRFIRYGNGAIFLYFKHKMYKTAFTTCLRALGGSVKALLKFDLKLSFAYFIAFFSRFSMFVRCCIFQFEKE